MIIREATVQDVPRLTEIYNLSVTGSTATFELIPQTIKERMEWFSEHGGRYPLLVAEVDSVVAGYSCISRYRPKPGYNFTVESSVYVAPSYHRQGIGRALMEELMTRTRDLGYHAILAGITAENLGSIRLHESLGFTLVGTMRQVGYKFGRWLDNNYYQRLLTAN